MRTVATNIIITNKKSFRDEIGISRGQKRNSLFNTVMAVTQSSLKLKPGANYSAGAIWWVIQTILRRRGGRREFTSGEVRRSPWEVDPLDFKSTVSRLTLRFGDDLILDGPHDDDADVTRSSKGVRLVSTELVMSLNDAWISARLIGSRE